MERAEINCVVKTFIKFINPNKEEMLVKTRNIDELDLPEECEFYFYDSYVGIIDGVEYPFGPEMNTSKVYFKASEHYVDPDYFRVYEMRCYGWDEEKIWNPDKVEAYKLSVFPDYTLDNYPQGVVIINQIICNPGADGIILAAKRTINTYEYPSKEVLKAYGHDIN